jgi:hypothetical protein
MKPEVKTSGYKDALKTQRERASSTQKKTLLT